MKLLVQMHYNDHKMLSIWTHWPQQHTIPVTLHRRVGYYYYYYYSDCTQSTA